MNIKRQTFSIQLLIILQDKIRKFHFYTEKEETKLS